MAKCQQCGAEVREGAKFCEVCGAKIEEQQPKQGKYICPICGLEVPPDAMFCPHCGCRFGPAPAPQAPAQPEVPQQQPAPAPQAAPAQPAMQVPPAPAPQPATQQAYQQPVNNGYPQQPVNNPAPQAEQPKGPLPLIRSLIINIGMFIVYIMTILVFIMPFSNYAPDNYFNYLTPLFDFSGVEPSVIALRIYNILIAIMPAIGFLCFGTIALISGIQGLIRKTGPKYSVCGFMFAFFMPLFAINSFQSTNDISGFSFSVFQSPAFIMLFIAFILYIAFGITDAFLVNAINKKGLKGPIYKAIAAVIGAVVFLFAFGANAAVVEGTQSSVTHGYMYTYSVSILMNPSSDISMFAVLPMMHGFLYIVALVFSGLAIADLFSPSLRKGKRVAMVILSGVSFAMTFASPALFVMAVANTTHFTLSMPSVCGYAMFVLIIVLLVFGNLAKNQEKALRRQQMQPRRPY